MSGHLVPSFFLLSLLYPGCDLCHTVAHSFPSRSFIPPGVGDEKRDDCGESDCDWKRERMTNKQQSAGVVVVSWFFFSGLCVCMSEALVNGLVIHQHSFLGYMSPKYHWLRFWYARTQQQASQRHHRRFRGEKETGRMTGKGPDLGSGLTHGV